MPEAKATAKLRNLDITPRKVRRVTHLLKGLQVDNALAELTMNSTRSVLPLTKLIRSAAANAKEKKLNPEKLVIGSIRVDEGRTLKRLLPQGRGRASLVRKRFSHVTVELVELDSAQPKGFLMPKRVKKAKELPARTPKKVKPAAEEPRAKEKKGFMQKVFSRKAV